eukprot:1115692-Rhodomonas_salina.1
MRSRPPPLSKTTSASTPKRFQPCRSAHMLRRVCFVCWMREGMREEGVKCPKSIRSRLISPINDNPSASCSSQTEHQLHRFALLAPRSSLLTADARLRPGWEGGERGPILRVEGCFAWADAFRQQPRF